jgi:uncharacterized protein (DUF885 family)
MDQLTSDLFTGFHARSGPDGSFPLRRFQMHKGFAICLSFALVFTSLTFSANALAADSESSNGDLRELIERFTADRESLIHRYDVPFSSVRDERFTKFYKEWLATLAAVDFDKLNQEGKVDYLLLQSHIRHAQRILELRQKQFAEMAPLLPFSKTILDLAEARRAMELPRPQQDARQLAAMIKEIAKTREAAEAGLGTGEKSPDAAKAGNAPTPIHVSKTTARRAAQTVGRLREVMKNWFEYYDGYDPLFTWWVADTYKQADKDLESYGKFIDEKLVGIKPDDKTTIIGDPIGRDALLVELADAMIPYTPEELIALAKNEMAWCTEQMKKASREMGYGDDWHKALEKVKEMHVPPGEQPELIRKLSHEASEYLAKNDLVTVPPLAEESWGMRMMTPERQIVNPFFTGGEDIAVSYPTDTMTYEQRMMSMRGNNIPFARATVFHELIPGHHLQEFMNDRYRSYRHIFETPFWIEGNAFYWEMLFWDMGFAHTPEERVGMLFWRMHRCARIIFSLSFHLGLWTPQQCVDFLINDVGHEPDNASAEVRRSFDGSYSPLYQCAYMLGALQFWALRQELVASGKMTNRQFHDAILHENAIPLELLRADLTQQKLQRDFTTSWKFYADIAHKP